MMEFPKIGDLVWKMCISTSCRGCHFATSRDIAPCPDIVEPTNNERYKRKYDGELKAVEVEVTEHNLIRIYDRWNQLYFNNKDLCESAIFEYKRSRTPDEYLDSRKIQNPLRR